MRVLLVSPNTLKVPYPVYPLGLDYVASALQARHEVRIADLNHISRDLLISQYIIGFNPEIIGLSLRNIDTTDQAAPGQFTGFFRSVADLIRRHTKVPLVLGGSGYSLFPRQLLELLGAQYGIVGDGERMVQLLDAIESRADIQNLDDIYTTTSGNSGADNSARPAMVLPQPPSADIVPYYLDHGGMLNLQTKRGCPYRCIYCTYPRIEGRSLRCLPPSEVARTAKALEHRGAKFIFITDSVFNADYDHSCEVAKAFGRVKLGIPWGGFFAPSPPPSGYYHRLVETGLTHVEFGTDTLSNQLLKTYQKPFTVDHVLKAHHAAHEAGLHVAHYFILGGPGENRDTLDETLSNVDKLHRSVLFFFGGMRIYPHTPLYKLALSERQVAPKDKMLTPVYYQSKGISSTEIFSRIGQAAKGKPHWLIGSGGDQATKVLEKMYAKGYSGPLWEYLLL